MLYVSRLRVSNIRSFESNTMVGVVDTDDGVEEFISEHELQDIIKRYDLEVEGVNISKDDGSTIYVFDIMPYQLSETYTPRQIKTLVLYGVLVLVYENEVSGVIIDEDMLKDGVRIRFSDFATKLSGACQIKFENPTVVEREIVLVFDDKIEIVGKPLDHQLDGVYFDVSEVQNQNLISQIFRWGGANSWFWRNYVIDRQNRDFGW